jgi:hypothetical protein
MIALPRSAGRARPGFWANRKANWLWLAAYLACVAAVVLLMREARRSTLEALSTPQAKAEWQAWRESEPNTTDQGPVKRRAPSSSEPPALVLLRDHYGVMLAGAVLFGSLLFAAVMVAVRGVLSRPAAARRDAN